MAVDRGLSETQGLRQGPVGGEQAFDRGLLEGSSLRRGGVGGAATSTGGCWREVAFAGGVLEGQSLQQGAVGRACRPNRISQTAFTISARFPKAFSPSFPNDFTTESVRCLEVIRGVNRAANRRTPDGEHSKTPPHSCHFGAPSSAPPFPVILARLHTAA